MDEDIEQKILAIFDDQDFVIGPAVAEKIGVSKPTAYRYLRELAMKGKVDFQKSGSVRIWYRRKNLKKK